MSPSRPVSPWSVAVWGLGALLVLFVAGPLARLLIQARPASLGAAFRDQILAKGNSRSPEELYRNFMGRDPDPGALLVRTGLVA